MDTRLLSEFASADPGRSVATEDNPRALAKATREAPWREFRGSMKPGDGWGIFEVQSDRKLASMAADSNYRVALASCPVGGDLNGECSCDDFQYRCLPNLEKTGKIMGAQHDKDTRTRCKHIERCRREALRQYLWRGLTNELTQTP